jgi:hypothetical protein
MTHDRWLRCRRLRGELPDGEIVLRRHSEGVGDAVEEGEHGRDVDCLGDLVFGPALATEFLYIFGRGAIRRFGNLLNVFE